MLCSLDETAFDTEFGSPGKAAQSRARVVSCKPLVEPLCEMNGPTVYC